MEHLLSILNAAWMILFIIFFFGFCIFIHEFGHMIIALWCGLVVEKFSIGFGKKIWGFSWRGIEFAISLLPFGGYVALPQIDIAEPSVDKDGKTLPHAKPLARAATAFAGPLFNVLFGFFLATIMWIAGLWVAPPANSVVVTQVPRSLPLYHKNSVQFSDKILAVDGKETDQYLEDLCLNMEASQTPRKITVLRDNKEVDVNFLPKANPEWAAGLRPGDRIITVNGKHFTGGIDEMRKCYVYNDQANVELEVLRDGLPLKFSYMAEPNPLWENLGFPFFAATNPLGISAVRPGSPAEKAGLKPGDQLLQFNKENIVNAKSLFEKIKAAKGKPFILLYNRNGEDRLAENLQCSPDRPEDLGLVFSITICNVLKNSPGEHYGLQNGDIAVKFNDQFLLDYQEFSKKIRASEGKPFDLTILRRGKEIHMHGLKAAPQKQPDGTTVYLLGIQLSDQATKIIGHVSPWKQFSDICVQTGKTISLLFAPVTSKITGHQQSKTNVGLKHMSGPAGIITILWASLQNEGIRGGLGFIILITFSLALMNLLPLPVLDGGHIVFSFIEIILRRKLPGKFIGIIQNIFAVLLIALFLYITFFDGVRIFKYIKVFFGK